MIQLVGMLRNLLTISGLIIFIAGISIFNNIRESENKALLRDDDKKGYGIITGEFLPCNWEVKEPERVIAEDKSAAILVGLKNTTSEKCESTISMRAPGLEIVPMKEEQTVTLSASKSGSISWILSPRKTGEFQIAVSDSINTKIYGVTVKNIYGLSTTQAKMASLIGSIFGPMITLPWWWDRLRGKKKEKDNEKINI